MRYLAFISYSRVDRVEGQRFHRALEHYRIPKPLRGVNRGYGAVPKRLTPLYLDLSDAKAGANLHQELKQALFDSAALVPLCSPAGAYSPWVNTEIREFKALGRGARIFPVILSGTPRRFDPERAPDGAFPPALFQRVDDACRIVAEDDPDPLAADVRPEGDGFDKAKLKIVAALTGISLTELTERQQEAERREKKIVRWVAGVMTALFLIATAAAVKAYYSAEAARSRLSSAIEMAARRVDSAVTYNERYGVPIEVVKELLNGAERDFSTLIGDKDTEVPVAELQRARLFRHFSRLYEVVGNSAAQLEQANKAGATLDSVPVSRRFAAPTLWFATFPHTAELVDEQLAVREALISALSNTEDPDDAVITAKLDEGRDLAARMGRPDYVARFLSLAGDRQYLAGDLPTALAAHDAALAALDAQPESSATSRESTERAKVLSNRAKVLIESERHQEALADLAAAIKVFEAQVAAGKEDNQAQQDLGQSLTRHADAQYGATASWTDSVPEYERALAVFDRLQKSDPTRIDYARHRSVVLERLGAAMLQTGNLVSARKYYEGCTDQRRANLGRDPRSPKAQRDLAACLTGQGDLARAEGDPGRAVARFEEAVSLLPAPDTSVPIEERNPVAARDFAILWSSTATARVEAKSPKSFSEAYEVAIALMEPFLDLKSTPDGWLRDVAVFRVAYGDALARAGRAAEARRQWAAALDLTERHLGVRPGDPRLLAGRRDLHSRLATGQIPRTP